MTFNQLKKQKRKITDSKFQELQKELLKNYKDHDRIIRKMLALMNSTCDYEVRKEAKQ